ncbi:DUF1405 domain-containing protein [Paenibacillus donghaensis]|uniref:DUF1405 domain-containing protein n=1 Tax=Paenibacillus donghaensis TaxID=414771 RepID=A0A2Z2KR86_9BACL|nr:DUF1405 domain-containing protein [Paenibacillus donghaensis]ASA22901.1 hypothetical protein B9T62_20085 [Paenibacillus donghaensis]
MAVHWFEKLFKNRGIIWLLFIVNLLGTIYGYIWYGDQMEATAASSPLWLLPFVPDSPTASLFFTLALLLLLYPPKSIAGTVIRELVEALAVLTSVKYGIWAVGIIFAGAAQGDVLNWKDWMLVVSHTGMAVEALLYARFFAYRRMLPLALFWTLANDFIDYSFGVYPWLPGVLDDDVVQVQYLTLLLTAFSTGLAWVFSGRYKPVHSRLPYRSSRP